MKIEWLGEIFVVPGAPSHFAFRALSVRRQSDRLLPSLAFFRFDNQIQSAAVGQFDIAYQDVKSEVVEELERAGQIRRRHDLVTAMGEKIGKNRSAGFMIFYQ